ncbi:MFS transporter [Microlunatus capsulatus]|uniref:MFS family arabinose efflux permease n=1 Tax=Microlunatus capsulatus TaxID=99117 RepID=A0ABS4Z556_9ACTN|nr:MFS transporter [Microlunatus capsulatus]MBP2416171.1 putative MFS family arabinose efflux permease [Microlunatus capsulatus]
MTQGAAEQTRPAPTAEVAWTPRLLALAVAAAVAVAVIYIPQSLLTDVAADLGVSPGAAGLVATAVQAGYALGILLLVPLADRVHPRRQITVQSVLLAAALALSATLPTVAAVAAGFAVVGLVANIAQVVIPAAGRLAPAARRGTTTATIVGSLSVGIFGGRILASLVVESVGWRWVAVGFAALVLATVPFTRWALRDAAVPAEAGTGYPRLLLDTLALVRRSPQLAQSALLQFFVFATFNSAWTVMVLHLTAEPYGWSVRAAGLFGLVGLAAGLTTPLSGRLVDRFGTLPVAGAALAVMLVAMAAVVVDADRLVPFALSMFAATAAGQLHQSAHQSRVLALEPERAAQANTVFMFFVFLGGSAGAFLGPAAYAAGGMARVGVVCCGLLVVALAAWAVVSLRARRAAPATR